MTFHLDLHCLPKYYFMLFFFLLQIFFLKNQLFEKNLSGIQPKFVSRQIVCKGYQHISWERVFCSKLILYLNWYHFADFGLIWAWT